MGFVQGHHSAVCSSSLSSLCFIGDFGKSCEEKKGCRVAEHTEMAAKREETMKIALVSRKLCREPFKLIHHIYSHTAGAAASRMCCFRHPGDKPWKSTTTRVTLGYVRVRELLALWEDAAAQGWESALLFQGNGVKHFLQSTE